MSETETQTTETGENWRGKVGLMTDQERDEFLAGGTLARLAVLDDNGWPYVQPVWFQWEPAEGIFWIIARKKSAWALFMKNNPKVAITIDGEERPYKKVTVQGTAEVVEEPNVGGPMGRDRPQNVLPLPGRARSGLPGADARQSSVAVQDHAHFACNLAGR